MLSAQYPELCKAALSFPGGLNSFAFTGDSTPRLILKMPPSFLLAAKLGGGFKLYVVPVHVHGQATVGIMCAFFDDPDCPLTLWCPQADDPASRELMRVLKPQDILVHLFDEHDREILGYRARVEVPLIAKIRLEHAKLLNLDHDGFHMASEAGSEWFSIRTSKDDVEAISIHFGEPLFPEDLEILDIRHELYSFHGAKGFGHSALVRPEPGAYQEADIILQLQKFFDPKSIYHAPKRVSDREEIADVVVITDDICLIIQAKDSPNTEDSLSNTLDRKRKKSVKQLEKGAGQARGAINYLRRTQPLRMLVDDVEIEIEIGARMVLSLIVVRELFMDSYREYSDVLFDLFSNTSLPCIALDYLELQSYATYCEGAHGFLSAYFQVFDFARARGEFPRLRFGLNDVKQKRMGFSPTVVTGGR